MEAELIRRELSYYKCVCVKTAVREETVEVILPESIGDAESVIDAQATVFLRSKESEDGLARLRGSIEGSVLLRNVDGRLCSLPFQSECRLEWTGEELKREALLCAEIRLYSVDSRILNPKKLLVSAELAGEIREWQEQKASYISAVNGNGIEQKIEGRSIPFVSAVTEKAFAVTENFSLSEEQELISEVLLSRCESNVTEVHSVAGKLIMQGTTVLDILYIGDEGSVKSQRFSTPWSQLIDITAEPESSLIRLMPTALYVDCINSGESVALELHLTAQVICTAVTELELLTDAYSTDYESELSFGEISILAPSKADVSERVLQFSADIPDGEAETILHSYGEVGEKQNSVYKISVETLFLDNNGNLKCVKSECAMEAGEGEGKPILRELRATINGNKLENRVTLTPQVESEKNSLLRWVDGISLLEDRPIGKKNRPGLIAIRKKAVPVWDLAKKYGSTVALIEKENETTEEKDTFLFIPRVR